MELSTKLQKIIEHLQKEFASIRSGRAHPSLIENVNVNVYEQTLTLKDVATINVQDAQTLAVTVWDAANVETADKALRHANLSLNPRLEGNKLYIVLPPITDERRQEFSSLLKQKAEQAKISVRNARRETNDANKAANKTSTLSDDELKAHLKTTQQATDETIQTIDTILKKKQLSIQNP